MQFVLTANMNPETGACIHCQTLALVRSTTQAAVAVAVTVGSFSDPEARDDKKVKLGQSEKGGV